MKIYGYEELCAGNCNIVCYEFDSTVIGIVNSKTGEVNCTHINYGRWFDSFPNAKKAMIKELKEEIEDKQKLVDEIKSLTKKDIVDKT